MSVWEWEKVQAVLFYAFLAFGFPPLADPPLSPTRVPWTFCLQLSGPERAYVIFGGNGCAERDLETGVCLVAAERSWQRITGCARYDADLDGDVDLRDWAAIECQLSH